MNSVMIPMLTSYNSAASDCSFHIREYLKFTMRMHPKTIVDRKAIFIYYAKAAEMFVFWVRVSPSVGSGIQFCCSIVSQ